MTNFYVFEKKYKKFVGILLTIILGFNFIHITNQMFEILINFLRVDNFDATLDFIVYVCPFVYKIYCMADVLDEYGKQVSFIVS